MERNKKTGRLIMLLALGFLLSEGISIAGDGSITIESPKPDEVIKGDTVTVVWKQIQEGKADHVHLIIDGQRRFPVLTESQKTLRLRAGEHEITLQAATQGHELLEPRATVKFKLVE